MSATVYILHSPKCSAGGLDAEETWKEAAGKAAKQSWEDVHDQTD